MNNPSETYSREMLDLMFKGVHTKLDLILEIKDDVKNMNAWKNRIVGGLTIITFIATPAIAILYKDVADLRRNANNIQYVDQGISRSLVNGVNS